MKHVSVALAAALLIAPALAGADNEPTVAPGSSVRVTEGGRRYTAKVLESLPDALLVRVRPDAPPRRLDLSRLERLEVSAGEQGHAGSGFLIGFLPGAALGALLGAIGGCANNSCELAAVTGLVGGLITGAAGALIGWAIRTERWQPVDVPSRPAVRVQPHVAPVRGGVMAGLTLRF